MTTLFMIATFIGSITWLLARARLRAQQLTYRQVSRREAFARGSETVALTHGSCRGEGE